MLRRTVAKAMGAAAVTAALGACTTNPAKSRPAPTSGALAVRDLQFNRGGDRPLPTRVWHPATGGPFPLIHFSHGLTTGPEYSAELLEFWARSGFVVAAPAAYDEVPWPKAFLTVTDGDHDYTPATFGVYASATTDFWRWSLHRDEAAKARLGADATAGREATLEDRL